MKNRKGFVSNSSSSSFIVLFTDKPQNEMHLKNMMFPLYDPDETISSKYDSQEPMKIRDIVSRVYSDICNGQDIQQDKYNIESIDVAMSGYIDAIDNDDYFREAINELRDAEVKLYHQFGEKYGYEDEEKWKSDTLYGDYLRAKEYCEKEENAYMEQREKDRKEFYNDFRNKYKYHKFQYILEYGDRHGEDILENEDIFRNVPHIKISHH